MTRFAQRLRARCSYANVAATLALVLAASGGAYAAASLPRNSVGSSQIVNGSIRSRDVHNRTLGVHDLSVAARRSLRGSRGPEGPAGPTALTFRTGVTAGGDPVAGNATGASHSAGSNEYRVFFSRDVSGCTPIATLATVPGGGDPPPGRITVAAGNVVRVRTFDAAGAPVATSFNLVVAC
jgi:hypothetical protein